ncbi:LCP family protein [Brevibacillus fulvus]|uniref:LCP family protein required for cell wall assembly n=1 Tax=Brevibacillus fulvus TaxID=1125967 RepID=A0A939BU32_9BACL|nr:LCP family protein required for cell wall assembly [Brevibacillus fulvus]
MKPKLFRITWKRSVTLVLALALAAAIGYSSYSFYEYRQMTHNWYQPLEEQKGPVQSITPQPSAPLPLPGSQPPQPSGPAAIRAALQTKPLKPFLLLLIGIDSREGERARSDTTILAAINPGKQRAFLLSIPRDTYMELPGRGYDKVNHAMAYGGPKLLKQTLEKCFQVKIDHYMTIDFDGFRKVVDELGGVTVNVKKRMKYTDPSDDTKIDLYPGVQTLNGKQALDYARYRKSDLGHEDSDYERIKRQQEILQALANKGDSVQAFLKAFKLMQIMGQHVKTDLTEEQISSLLVTYYDPDRNELQTQMLAGRDERIWHNGILGWYYLISSKEKARVHMQLLKELAS